MPYTQPPPGTSLYSTTTPDLNTIAIEVDGPFGTVKFDRFISYDYQQEYTAPSDSFSFTLDRDELNDNDILALRYRSKIRITVNGNTQMIGYIGPVEYNTDNGTVVTISGKDWLGPAVEGHIDPKTQFKPQMTLEQLIYTALSPFGVSSLIVDDIANSNSISGRIYGNPTSKKGKPIESYQIHELHPFQNESAYAFASRISQRFGLWIRPSVEFGTAIVAAPNFTQDVRYALVHKANGPVTSTNNVHSSHVKWDGTNQPSAIIANAATGGGEFSHSGVIRWIPNPLVAADLTKIVKEYPGTMQVKPEAVQLQQYPIFSEPYTRPLYLHDPESHTAAQLESFLRRQLSLSMRHAFSGRYTIMGSRLNGQSVAVDTMISIDDDRSDVHQNMWILSRHFHKAAGQGTATTIEVILPGALQF